MRENREVPRLARPVMAGGSCGEGLGGKPQMHGRGKSDGPVVPAKPPNKAAAAAAEVVEGRGPAKGNTASETRPGHRAGWRVKRAGSRARGGAKDKGARFTALLHHVTWIAWGRRIGRSARGPLPGVDGVTWGDYGQDLEANLRDLHAPGARGELPGEAVAEGLHPEGRTGGCGRSASPRWRTRSCSGRWLRR